MGDSQGDRHDLLFALGVKIDSTHFSLDLVEADIVEALKTRAGYGTHAVVWHQKVFLPSHEDILPLGHISNGIMTVSRLLLNRPECIEFGPMAHVDLAVGTPTLILSKEAVLGADNLSLKVGGEGWVVLGQP